MKRILITGGTGLVGERLSKILKQKGYEVGVLTRQPEKGKDSSLKYFKWDPSLNQIDPHAIEWAEGIIHLAGAGVADKRWSKSRKEEILNSRVSSTNLLNSVVQKAINKPSVIVSASAIGFYGFFTGAKLLVETDVPGNDFLADVTLKWEQAVDKMPGDLRKVKLRVGVVLSTEGGALPKLMQPVKLGAGAALASGSQYISWIHIDDLCEMFVKSLEDEQMSGAYNAVAPNPVTNKELTTAIAQKLHKPLFLPNVPAFILKIMLGEMAYMVIEGNNVSCRKILDTGFKFKYRTVNEALEELIPSV